jgi:hypothetical protein
MQQPVIQNQHTSIEIEPDPSSKGLLAKPAAYCLETIAISFWIYVITKLFVYDIDMLLVNTYFPNAAWIINYKFFILLGLTIIILLIFRTKSLLLYGFYVLGYPFILLFWTIPKLSLKNNRFILIFSLVNSIVSFFRSFKYNFIVSASWMISVAVVLSSDNNNILTFSSVVLFALLVLNYINRFILIFRPTTLSVYKNIFSSTCKYLTTSQKLDNNIRILPVTELNDEQLKLWTTNLQMSVMVNRIFLLSAKMLRRYQDSGITIASGIITTIFLVVVTTITFAVINLALFKCDRAFFDMTETPTLFTFLHYSFKAMLFTTIRELTPITRLSESVSMAENFFALVLIAIFASQLISVKSQRLATELNQVIASIEAEGRFIESFIRSEYKIDTIDAALAELERLKASLMRFLVFLTRTTDSFN